MKCDICQKNQAVVREAVKELKKRLIESDNSKWLRTSSRQKDGSLDIIDEIFGEELT